MNTIGTKTGAKSGVKTAAKNTAKSGLTSMQGQARGQGSSHEVIRSMLKDEEAFMRRAGPRELTQAVLYFRNKASTATTPQLRDFYLDRAHQFSIRAVIGGNYGVYGVQRTRAAG